MAEQFANNASTTLNGGINNSVTSVVVTDGSVFPSSGDFRLLVGAEIMLCTARSGNTLTVTRGHESTTASSHSSGATIELVYTKGSFETFLGEYQSSGGYASRPSSPRKGQEYFATDLLDAQWYYDGNNWDLLHPTYVPYSSRIDLTGWTAINHGGWTFTTKNGILEVLTDAGTGNMRGYYKAHGLSTPYSHTFILPPWMHLEEWWTFYHGYRDSVSGRILVGLQAGSTIGVSAAERWNNASSWASNATTGNYTNAAQPRFLKQENDGTNIAFYTSVDGKHFTKYWSESKTNWLTNNQDQVFFGFYRTSTYPGSGISYMHLLGLKEN